MLRSRAPPECRALCLDVAGWSKRGAPAADLAVAAALVSSFSGVPVPPGTVVFGEIGLSGEVRAVAQVDARLKEAQKLGFVGAIIPAQRRAKRSQSGKPRKDARNGTMEITEISRLEDLLKLFAKPDGERTGPPATSEPAARHRSQ